MLLRTYLKLFRGAIYRASSNVSLQFRFVDPHQVKSFLR